MKLKENVISEFESRYESSLEKSTWIEAFKQSLMNFPELGSIQTWGEDLINDINEQLYLLNELGFQIMHFKDNPSSLLMSTSEIEAGFTQYEEQEAQNKSKLATLFTQHALSYFQEKNNFYKQLSDEKLPFLLTGLNLDPEVNFESQLNTCIQLINNHVKNPEKLINFFEIIKHSSLSSEKQNLSHFILIAHDQATQLLQKMIEKNFEQINLQQIKQDCENQDLYSALYQNTLLQLANHYQDYSNKLNTIKNKLEFLDKHLGETVKDWLVDYKTLSDNTFLSTAHQEALVEKYHQLCLFETQLSLNDDKEFLKKIKHKVHDFLNNEIESLEQQFQDYQTRIAEFSRSSTLAESISDKLLQIQEAHFNSIKEIWIKRQKRLDTIQAEDDLINFKQHFPKEKPFDSNSLNFNELYAAISLLEASNPATQTEMYIQNFLNIPLENLTEKILFILENLDDTQLPGTLNNLLQFIHLENSNPTLNATQAYLATALQDFFTHQPKKIALCITQNAPMDTVVNPEVYDKLINILYYIDSDQLEKNADLKRNLRSKVQKLSPYDESDLNTTNQVIDRLISTKKIIQLFEDKNIPTLSDSENNNFTYSLWDACCLFQQFAKNAFSPELPYLRELNKKTKIKDEFFDFQNDVLNLDCFLRDIKKLENKSYSPTLFLKSGAEKQECVNQLINNLKNIPITQLDRSTINDTFEQWKKDHQLIIDKPRYRFLIKLCMFIKKIIFPHSNSVTDSHQTVDKLHECISKINEHLQNLRSHFTHSVPVETTETQLTYTARP